MHVSTMNLDPLKSHTRAYFGKHGRRQNVKSSLGWSYKTEYKRQIGWHIEDGLIARFVPSAEVSLRQLITL